MRLVRGAETQKGLVPHSPVADKNWKADLCYRGPLIPWWAKITQYYTRPPSPGFQCHKEKSLKLLDVKTSSDYDWVTQRASGVSDVPLKGPVHGLTQIHPLWVPVLEQQLRRHQGCGQWVTILFQDMFVVGTVHQLQGMVFHGQSKLAFKSKALVFKLKIED